MKIILFKLDQVFTTDLKAGECKLYISVIVLHAKLALWRNFTCPMTPMEQNICFCKILNYRCE